MLPGVSAAMIVRDESTWLPHCLESLVGKVDDVVIVDTGSTDDTIAIAEHYGARVFHHRWEGDFAAARNRAQENVRFRWTLYIDADEAIETDRPVGSLVEDDTIAGFVQFRPKTGFTRYREWRLFRSDLGIRFHGRIHETIMPSIHALLEKNSVNRVGYTGLKLNHFGYDGPQDHKHQRNLPLLQDAVRTYPSRIYLWHHLTETLHGMGRDADAVATAHEGLKHARQATDEKDRAAASMMRQYLIRRGLLSGSDQRDQAANARALYLEDWSLVYLHGLACLQSGDPETALENAKALLAVDPEALSDGMLAYNAGIFSFKALELAGKSAVLLGRHLDACAYFARRVRCL